jgi:hypothetical protein
MYRVKGIGSWIEDWEVVMKMKRYGFSRRFLGFVRHWFTAHYPLIITTCLIALLMYGNFVLVITDAMERQSNSKTMMLHQLTWQQFLVAAAVLTLVWYGVLFVSWYLRGKAAGENGNVPVSTGLPHRWEKGVDRLSDGYGLAEADDLMGRPQEEEGFRRVSMNELRFAGAVVSAKPEVTGERVAEYPSVAAADALGFLQGTVADFLEELKPVFDYAARYKKGLAVFLEHLQALVERYPEIRQSPNWEAIVGHICELAVSQLPFEVKPEQIHFFLEMGEVEPE